MEKKAKKQPKLKIKKGDTVKVISGEYKKKSHNKGKVLQVFPEDNTALVEGINLVKKHLKANVDKNYPNGGIIEKEAPIHISNLALVDASGNITKVGRKLNDKGKLQRYSKKTGDFIADPAK